LFASLSLSGWELLVAVVVVALVLGMIAMLLVTREAFHHRWRVGFFIERDLNENQQKEEPHPEE
jgi:hypothetical protein